MLILTAKAEFGLDSYINTAPDTTKTRFISGHVISAEDHTFLKNALIKEPLSRISTRSHEGGEFHLSVPLEANILEVSLQGYYGAAYQLGKSDLVKLSLYPDAGLLAEEKVKTFLLAAKDSSQKETPAKLAISESLYQIYINQHISYPKAFTEMGQEGTVALKFKVKADGSLSHFTVEKSIGKDFDKAAIEVLKKGPKWIPAIKNGKPASSFATHYVNFIHL